MPHIFLKDTTTNDTLEIKCLYLNYYRIKMNSLSSTQVPLLKVFFEISQNCTLENVRLSKRQQQHQNPGKVACP